jgi:hypothetical protein
MIAVISRHIKKSKHNYFPMHGTRILSWLLGRKKLKSTNTFPHTEHTENRALRINGMMLILTFINI